MSQPLTLCEYREKKMLQALIDTENNLVGIGDWWPRSYQGGLQRCSSAVTR
jgi:hypothetical protein